MSYFAGAVQIYREQEQSTLTPSYRFPSAHVPALCQMPEQERTMVWVKSPGFVVQNHDSQSPPAAARLLNPEVPFIFRSKSPDLKNPKPCAAKWSHRDASWPPSKQKSCFRLACGPGMSTLFRLRWRSGGGNRHMHLWESLRDGGCDPRRRSVQRCQERMH